MKSKTFLISLLAMLLGVSTGFSQKGMLSNIDGKSIDVYAENEKKIGAEVAMSAKGEVENIKKDLKLNLDHLIVACKDERVMSDIGMKAKDTIGREKVKEVKFKVVRDVF